MVTATMVGVMSQVQLALAIVDMKEKRVLVNAFFESLNTHGQ